MKDDLLNYLKTLQNKVPNNLVFLPTRVPPTIRTHYALFMYNKASGEQVARLTLGINRRQNVLVIHGGSTEKSHEGRGIGTFLRAVATKMGALNGRSKARQLGIYTSNRSKELGVPNSTRILKRLGWTVVKNTPNVGLHSEFNYKKNNIKKVNNAIRNFKR